MSEEDERGAAGWVLLAALLGYSLFCHQGLGLPKANAPMVWYLPTGFLNGWPVIGEFSEDWRIGALILLLPAALLATGVFLKTASAVARALAVSSVMAVLLFSFYGFSEADRVWEFFHWRGSIVFAGTALAIGSTIAAPLLAKSWLRLGWKGRSLSYLPLAFAIIALERHATGWDEDLFFNFSPWPALPVLGFEYAAFILIGILFGVALAVSGVASLERRPGTGLLLVAAGLAFPVGWFSFRFSLPDIELLSALFFAGAISVGLVSLVRSEKRSSILARRAGYIALGAALAYFPLFTGRAMAAGDYNATRFVIAAQVSDALAAFMDQEDTYPDELEELVEKKYLDEIPLPAVGFSFFYALGYPEIPFEYRGLGSSYVLEFVSTEWIQCAYNPPWDEEEYAEEDAEYAEEYPDAYDDGSEGAWSCPTTRPELW